MPEPTTADDLGSLSMEDYRAARRGAPPSSDNAEQQPATADLGALDVDAYRKARRAGVQHQPKPPPEPPDAEALRAAADRADAAERRATDASAAALRAEVRAAATSAVSDPDLALRILDLDALVNDDGTPNVTAVRSAIAALVEQYPELAAEKPRKFAGSADAGARGVAAHGPDREHATMAEYRAARALQRRAAQDALGHH